MKKGNIHVYYHGHFFVGPDWLFSLLLPGLVLFGSLLFVLYTNHIFGARCSVSFLCVLSLLLYAVAAFRDPGIIARGPPRDPGSPRPPSRFVRVPNHRAWHSRSEDPSPSHTHSLAHEEGEDPPSERQLVPPGATTEANSATTGSMSPPLFHIVEQRWCYTCHIYRPLRSVHCRFCDVCIHRRDHHCPWLGICVAARNYLYFYLLLWSLELLTVIAAVCGTHSLVQRTIHISYVCRLYQNNSTSMINNSNNSMWNSTPWGSPDEINCEMPALLESIAATYGIEFILIVLAYLAVTLLTTLIITQTSLALKNEVLGDEAHFDGISVYDKGSIWENLKAAFFFSPTEVALYEVVRHPHTEEEQEGNEGSVLEPEPDEGDGAAARPLPLSDDSLVEYVLSPGESAPHARRRIATEDSHAVLLEEEVEEEVPFSPTSLVVV